MKRTTTRARRAAHSAGRVQQEALRAVRRGYEVTLDLLPSRSRRAVEELADRLETVAGDWNRRRRRALQAADSRRKLLAHRLDGALKALERTRRRALTDAERRGSKLAESVEQRVIAAMRPLARRLEIVTVRDLQALNRRLAHLERKLGNGTRRTAA
jgi:polyhydroxyalkanoate synthesis regulator phasin